MDQEEQRAIVDTLTRLTKAKKLSWRLAQAPSALTDGSETIIPLYFSTDFNGRPFGAFEVRRKDYDGERDQFYWYTSTGVAIYAPRGLFGGSSPYDTKNLMPLVEIYQPQSEILELLETVRAQAADLPNLLAQLKAELPPEDQVPF